MKYEFALDIQHRAESRRQKQERFEKESRKRFSELDTRIDQKDQKTDKYFPYANQYVAWYIREYCLKRKTFFSSKETIRYIDCGPAIGGISSLFAMKEFDKLGLLDKVEVWFLNLSRVVLQRLRSGRFSVDPHFIKNITLPSMDTI